MNERMPAMRGLLCAMMMLGCRSHESRAPMMSHDDLMQRIHHHRAMIEANQPTTVPPQTIFVPIPAGSSYGKSIEKHWISAVFDDGSVIKLDDGSLWLVNEYDRYLTTIWLPMSDVLLVDDWPARLINIDDEESVEVERID